MSSWSHLCCEALWIVDELSFREFFAAMPYFVPAKIQDLKVGDRVVCIAKERSPVRRMSDLSSSQAWDVPVVRIAKPRVWVEWVSGIKVNTWFHGLVFQTPYVVSFQKYGKNFSRARRRRSDFFNTGKRFKYRCRFDDFLPNPKIRKLVYDKIMNNDLSTYKDLVSSEAIVDHSDIYLNTLQWTDRKKEVKLLLQRVITAHHQNSILGQMLKEGCLKKIQFVLKQFHVDKMLINNIRIGSNNCHPTEILIQYRQIPLLRYLEKKVKLMLSGKIKSFDRESFRHFSAVLSAIELGDPRILRSLIKAVPSTSLGRMLWFPDEVGRSPLSLAVVKDKPDFVKALVDAKAPVNQRGWGDDTALAIGMQLGASDACITVLLNAGSDVNTRDSTGVAPRARGIFGRLPKPSGL